MISPGAIVRCSQTGTMLWTVRSVAGEGSRVHLIARHDDGFGFSGRTAGIHDVIEVAPARIYSPGEQVTCDGVTYTVLQDRGDTVEFQAPEKIFRHRPTRTNLRIPAGQIVTLAKSDLALETLE